MGPNHQSRDRDRIGRVHKALCACIHITEGSVGALKARAAGVPVNTAPILGMGGAAPVRDPTRAVTSGDINRMFESASAESTGPLWSCPRGRDVLHQFAARIPAAFTAAETVLKPW